ncbi:hypothetical protein ACXC9Q_00030 [Kribbella sp. CWNU-51]
MSALVVGVLVAALLVWVVRPARRAGIEPAAASTVHDTPSRLLAWAVGALPADRAQWGEAMLGELRQLEGRTQRWRFALGCAAATLVLPSRRADAAGVAARLVAATAVACAGLVVYGLVRYPAVLTQHGTRPALATFTAVLAGYTLISVVLLRHGSVGLSGLAGGLALAAVWAIAGITAVSHSSQPAYSLLLLAIPLAALAVGAVAGRRRRTAAVRQQVVLLSAVVAGLVLFVVLAGDTLLTAGGPYDAGQLRDFPTSGLPDLATYAVSDNLGSAMMLLLLVPVVSATIGCAAAGTAARLRRDTAHR